MARAKNSMVGLPKGFKPIEHLGSFWKGEKPGDNLEGVYVKKTVKHFPKQGKYAARDANVHHIQVKGGRVIEVTQSGGLGALESVKKGQAVYIQFIGMKKIKGRSAMREYLVATK